MGQRRDHNPVIGYLAVDRTYRVLGPAGSPQNPAFGSPAAARAAASRGGYGAQVASIEALHLAGLLSVLGEEEGDVQLDGVAAQRFVAACQATGRAVDGRIRIDPSVPEASYSSRRLLGVARARPIDDPRHVL